MYTPQLPIVELLLVAIMLITQAIMGFAFRDAASLNFHLTSSNAYATPVTMAQLYAKFPTAGGPLPSNATNPRVRMHGSCKSQPPALWLQYLTH
jgi:hypothetical protein